MSLLPSRFRVSHGSADQNVETFCHACYAVLGVLGLIWLSVMLIAVV